MNFVAIDFETANGQRSSACAVGLSVVQGGKIVDEFHTLICPPTLDFKPYNIAVHHIEPEQVKGKPTFRELWPDLMRRLGGRTLVAHNADFDIDVLKACIAAYDFEPQQFKYACTLAMSRQLLPGLPNHKLSTLAAVFGIDMKNAHHDPSCDARTCAGLAIKLGRLIGDGLDSFIRDATEGAATQYDAAYEYHYPQDARNSSTRTIGLVETAKPDGRFNGLRFVFTGELVYLTREAAESLVKEQGGAPCGISKKTDYVVVSDEVLSAYRTSGATTGKLAKALELQKTGIKLKIICEAEFLKILSCPFPEATS